MHTEIPAPQLSKRNGSHSWGSLRLSPNKDFADASHASLHINQMLAVILASRSSSFKELRDYHVLVRSENRTVVAFINYQGGLRSCPLCRLASRLLLWAQRNLCSVGGSHARLLEGESRHVVIHQSSPGLIDSPFHCATSVRRMWTSL